MGEGPKDILEDELANSLGANRKEHFVELGNVLDNLGDLLRLVDLLAFLECSLVELVLFELQVVFADTLNDQVLQLLNQELFVLVEGFGELIELLSQLNHH